MIYMCLCAIWYSLSQPDTRWYQLVNCVSFFFVEGCLFQCNWLKVYTLTWLSDSVVLQPKALLCCCSNFVTTYLPVFDILYEPLLKLHSPFFFFLPQSHFTFVWGEQPVICHYKVFDPLTYWTFFVANCGAHSVLCASLANALLKQLHCMFIIIFKFATVVLLQVQNDSRQLASFFWSDIQ